MSSILTEFFCESWAGTHVQGKTVVCLPSLSKKHPKTTSATDQFEFGDALQWYSFLLQPIFQFLDARDLKTASLVNSLWKTLAEREMRKRIFAGWVSLSYRAAPKRVLQLSASFGFEYCYPAAAVIFNNQTMIDLNQIVWLNRSSFDVDNATTVAEYIGKELVQNNVNFCTISSRDVFLQETDPSPKKSIIYHGMLIPRIPNVTCTLFHCHSQNMLEGIIEDDDVVKCLLVFPKNHTVDVGNLVASVLNKQSPKSIALGGIPMSNSKIFRNKRSFTPDDDVFGICFTQKIGVKANFSAYSLLLSFECANKYDYYEKVETELIKLKQTEVLHSHGFIIGFSSFAQYVHNTETGKLLEKHFTRYHFVGFVSLKDTVIGWNSTNQKHKNQADWTSDISIVKKRKIDIPQMHHADTRTLVFITWNK